MRYQILILLLIVTSMTSPVLAQASAITAITDQTVNVRSGPGTQFDIVGKLHPDDEVAVLGRDSEITRWLYIRLPESEQTGWVAYFTVITAGDVQQLDLITTAAPTPQGQTNTPPTDSTEVTVQAIGRVNVRTGPGIDYEVISQLDTDQTATATARNNYNNDWLYIENGQLTGWVAYFTVNVSGNAADLPVLVPDALTNELVPPTALTRANFNVRLHTRAAFSSPVTDTLPYDTQVTLVELSPNTMWVYIVHDEYSGWGWRPLFDITDEQLATIPRQASMTPQ